jgi:hypothetical protein
VATWERGEGGVGLVRFLKTTLTSRFASPTESKDIEVMVFSSALRMNQRRPGHGMLISQHPAIPGSTGAWNIIPGSSYGL